MQRTVDTEKQVPSSRSERVLSSRKTTLPVCPRGRRASAGERPAPSGASGALLAQAGYVAATKNILKELAGGGNEPRRQAGFEGSDPYQPVTGHGWKKSTPRLATGAAAFEELLHDDGQEPRLRGARPHLTRLREVTHSLRAPRGIPSVGAPRRSEQGTPLEVVSDGYAGAVTRIASYASACRFDSQSRRECSW